MNGEGVNILVEYPLGARCCMFIISNPHSVRTEYYYPYFYVRHQKLKEL